MEERMTRPDLNKLRAQAGVSITNETSNNSNQESDQDSWFITLVAVLIMWGFLYCLPSMIYACIVHNYSYTLKELFSYISAPFLLISDDKYIPGGLLIFGNVIASFLILAVIGKLSEYINDVGISDTDTIYGFFFCSLIIGILIIPLFFL